MHKCRKYKPFAEPTTSGKKDLKITWAWRVPTLCPNWFATFQDSNQIFFKPYQIKGLTFLEAKLHTATFSGQGQSRQPLPDPTYHSSKQHRTCPSGPVLPQKRAEGRGGGGGGGGGWEREQVADPKVGTKQGMAFFFFIFVNIPEVHAPPHRILHSVSTNLWSRLDS